MKKIVAITLCGAMLIGGGVYARETAKTRPQNCIDLRQVEKDDPNLDLVPGGCVDIKNPFIDCKTIEEAEKIAGLKFMKPSKLPEGYKLKTVEAVKDELIQVTYVNKKDQFIIRQARGKEDISGDYNKYTFKKEIGVNGEKVYIRGKDSRIKVANWTNGDYTFALITENKSKGLKEKEFIKMLEGMIVAKYY